LKADVKKNGGAGSANKPKSATAFGRRAEPLASKPEAKPKEAPKSFVEYAAQGLSRVPEKGKRGAVAAMPSKELVIQFIQTHISYKITNDFCTELGARAPSDNARAARREDRLPDGDVQGAIKGISNLQLGVRGNRGPVIVNHEEDLDIDRNRSSSVGGLKALQQKIVRSKPRNSISDSASELEGVSEHLYNKSGNRNADGLNEDQLDRLLVKAKKTRAVGFDDEY
jgi:hypothetical protein